MPRQRVVGATCTHRQRGGKRASGGFQRHAVASPAVHRNAGDAVPFKQLGARLAGGAEERVVEGFAADVPGGIVAEIVVDAIAQRGRVERHAARGALHHRLDMRPQLGERLAEPRRQQPAARLVARKARPIEQRHAQPRAGGVECGGGSRGSAAGDEQVVVAHGSRTHWR